MPPTAQPEARPITGSNAIETLKQLKDWLVVMAVGHHPAEWVLTERVSG